MEIEEQKAKEEEQKIADFMAALPEDELESYYARAKALVIREHGEVKFGRETLIRLKLDDMIRDKLPNDELPEIETSED